MEEGGSTRAGLPGLPAAAVLPNEEEEGRCVGVREEEGGRALLPLAVGTVLPGCGVENDGAVVCCCIDWRPILAAAGVVGALEDPIREEAAAAQTSFPRFFEWESDW